MSPTMRPPAVLAMVALISVISAGCGSNAPSETGSASSASANSAGTGANKQASDRDKAVKFAECMRNNGVGDFPDPNAQGEFVYGASVSPAVFDTAVKACKALQPPGTLSSKRGPEQQTASLKFAQCMRDNGVKDFPDPINGQPLVDTNRIPSTATNGGMTILNAALHTCRNLLDKAAAGQ